MKISEFTAEQLADRWADHRAVENLMARWVYRGGILREIDMVWNDLWCKKNEPCLGFNDGYYKGAAAVEGYYKALGESVKLKTELVQQLHPEELSGKSVEEIWGAGTFAGDFISAPLIELAADGETAKGLWYVFGGEVDFKASGPSAERVFGHIGVDFIKEDGEWRIWHMLFVEDVRAPFGVKWTEPIPEKPGIPEYAALAAFKMPAPNVPVKVHDLYYPRRPSFIIPALPERYDTFAETFSYGI